MRGLGYIPDIPSDADWNASEKLGLSITPVEATNRDLVPTILRQGGLGSCTANAVGYALRAAMILQGIYAPELASRLFLYYLARATHGAQNIDSGTYLRAVLEVANKFGFPPESLWPYSDDSNPKTGRAFVLPSHKAFRAAYDQHAPTEYRRIVETGYDRVDVIKRAVAARHLVVFGTDVSQSFVQGSFDPTAPLDPPIGEAIAGGHAMAIAEYDTRGVGVPNSWGEDAGDKGWVRFGWDYIAWDKTRDLWIVEYAPVYSEAA